MALLTETSVNMSSSGKQAYSSYTKPSTKCTKCQQVLEAGVEYRNSVWHRECLTCSNCAQLLAATKFTTVDSKPYCCHCFADLFAYKCEACHLPIDGLGDGFLVYMEGRRWHIQCFSCRVCDVPLIGEITFNHADGVLCSTCVQQ